MIYGVENTLLCFPIEVFTAIFDGVSTFISPIVDPKTYVLVTLATTGAFAPERVAPALPVVALPQNGCVLAGPTVRLEGATLYLN